MGPQRFSSGSCEPGSGRRPGLPWRISLYALEARAAYADRTKNNPAGGIGVESLVVIRSSRQLAGNARCSGVAADGPACLVRMVNGGYMAASDRRSEGANLFLCAH